MKAKTAFARGHKRTAVATHVAGLALLAVAGAAAAGTAVEVATGGSDTTALVVSALVLAVAGGAMWRSTTLPPDGGGTVGAIRAVGVSWLVISAAGALPYVLTGVLSWDLALFESVSGLTGTGSTVMAPIEGHGDGILFYRQMTQWVGGMGVVVLAVAVLPFLGIGGLELFRAESAGPTSDQLVPRVSDTARRLWTIYCAVTALSAAILFACGMGPYDAVAHAATAVGTGGFSPYNDSISHFDSALVEAGITASMFLGATQFPLLFAVFRGRSLRGFWRSSEFRFYVVVVVGATAAVTALLALDGAPVASALRSASFNVVSLVSTCGFGTDDFTLWAPAAQLILLFLMATGSMSGSTSGALKLFRVQVMAKYAWREVRRVRRPRGVFPIRLGRRPIPEPIVRSVLGYVSLYVVVAVVSIVTVSLLGSDLVTSSGAVFTTMGGVGPGLGLAGPAANFLAFDGVQRTILVFLMLLGRLEVFPLILFLVPLSAEVRRRTKRVLHHVPRRRTLDR